MARVTEPFPTPESTALAATDAVRRFCGWHVAPVIEEVIELPGTCARSLQVPSLAIVKVIEARIGDTIVDPGSITRRPGFLMRHAGWGSDFDTVTVTIRHGVEDAYLGQLVQDVAARADASPAGHTSVRVGNVQTANAQTAPGVSGGAVLMAHEKAALAAYRLPGI